MSKPGRTNKIWNEHWFRWWNSQVWQALLVVSDSFVVCCLFSNDFFGLMIGKIYIYIVFFCLGWVACKMLWRHDSIRCIIHPILPMASFKDVGVDDFWLCIVFPVWQFPNLQWILTSWYLAANGEVAWWTRSLFKSGSTLKSRCDIFLLRWICTLLGSKWNFQHRDAWHIRWLKGEESQVWNENMVKYVRSGIWHVEKYPKFLLNFFTEDVFQCVLEISIPLHLLASLHRFCP